MTRILFSGRPNSKTLVLQTALRALFLTGTETPIKADVGAAVKRPTIGPSGLLTPVRKPWKVCRSVLASPGVPPAGQSGKFFVWSAGQTISMGHSPQLESPGSGFRSHPLRDIVSPERTCP